MIVDPPSFQKGSFVLTQDYRRILRRLPELLVPGGTLLACINDPAIGPDFLLEETAARRRRCTSSNAWRIRRSSRCRPAAGLKALLFRNAG